VGPSAGKISAIRPFSTTIRPDVDVPSPTAINAGPSVKLVDVEKPSFGTCRMVRRARLNFC
jgi:hypothetical protein